jgi:hypothetical protein
MSIINDAIKKARKEFEIKNKPVTGACDPPKQALPFNTRQVSSDIKWTVIVVVSLVVIISLLGSAVLYRYMSRIDTDTAAMPASSAGITPRPYRNLPGSGPRDTIELNGIVYGPEDKWVIINNKILREGDDVMGGKIVSIARDSVKIEENNGEETVLDLK